MNEQIAKLCKIASELDRKGHHKLASKVDSIVSDLVDQSASEYWKDSFARSWGMVEEGLMRYKNLMERIVSYSKKNDVGEDAVLHARKAARFADKQLTLWSTKRMEMDELLQKANTPIVSPSAEEHLDAAGIGRSAPKIEMLEEHLDSPL